MNNISVDIDPDPPILFRRYIWGRKYHAHNHNLQHKFFYTPQQLTPEGYLFPEIPIYYRGGKLDSGLTSHGSNKSSKANSQLSIIPDLEDESSDKSSKKKGKYKQKMVTIIRPGQKPPFNCFKILVSNNSGVSYSELLDDLSDAFGPKGKDSPVKYLLAKDGTRAMKMPDLFTKGNIFIATGDGDPYLGTEDIEKIIAETIPTDDSGNIKSSNDGRGSPLLTAVEEEDLDRDMTDDETPNTSSGNAAATELADRRNGPTRKTNPNRLNSDIKFRDPVRKSRPTIRDPIIIEEIPKGYPYNDSRKPGPFNMPPEVSTEEVIPPRHRAYILGLERIRASQNERERARRLMARKIEKDNMESKFYQDFLNANRPMGKDKHNNPYQSYPHNDGPHNNVQHSPYRDNIKVPPYGNRYNPKEANPNRKINSNDLGYPYRVSKRKFIPPANGSPNYSDDDNRKHPHKHTDDRELMPRTDRGIYDPKNSRNYPIRFGDFVYDPRRPRQRGTNHNTEPNNVRPNKNRPYYYQDPPKEPNKVNSRRNNDRREPLNYRGGPLENGYNPSNTLARKPAKGNPSYDQGYRKVPLANGGRQGNGAKYPDDGAYYNPNHPQDNAGNKPIFSFNKLNPRTKNSDRFGYYPEAKGRPLNTNQRRYHPSDNRLKVPNGQDSDKYVASTSSDDEQNEVGGRNDQGNPKPHNDGLQDEYGARSQNPYRKANSTTDEVPEDQDKQRWERIPPINFGNKPQHDADLNRYQAPSNIPSLGTVNEEGGDHKKKPAFQTKEVPPKDDKEKDFRSLSSLIGPRGDTVKISDAGKPIQRPSRTNRQSFIVQNPDSERIVPKLASQLPDDKRFENLFEMGRLLATGNFSEVKEVKKKSNGIAYAVKIIDKPKLKDKEDLVEEEIRILRSCDHPNIMQLKEQFESPQKVYLVSELVKEGDLFDAICAHIKFTESQAAVMVRDLARALFYLHSRGIVHRDIKPENLLVIKTNGIMNLKLADFGLAVETKDPLFVICGTATYVAPEILTEQGYGKAVDIWAAGVVAFILLCGFPPFRSADRKQTELFEFIKAGEFEYLSPYWDNVSSDARDLIDRMIVTDPSRRYGALDVLCHRWILSLGNSIQFQTPIEDVQNQTRADLQNEAEAFKEDYKKRTN